MLETIVDIEESVTIGAEEMETSNEEFSDCEVKCTPGVKEKTEHRKVKLGM